MKHILPLLLSAAALATVSCHHKRDDEALEYISGSLSFDMPSYVTFNQTLSLTPAGITFPKAADTGYVWTCSGLSIKDTVRTDGGAYVLTIADTVEPGTYTISCSAFATDHYSTSSSRTFTVVNPVLNGSLQGTGIADSDSYVADPQDNRYYFISIGGRDWFRNNLAVPAGESRAYDNSEAVSYIFGRYYTWEEARGACPEGWRLPTLSEWNSTFQGQSGDLMADATFNDKKMWEFWPDVRITNSTGLSAIPAGYAIGGEFTGLSSYAVFWTGTASSSEKAYYRYLYVNKPDIYLGEGDRTSFRASVRCVRN